MLSASESTLEGLCSADEEHSDGGPRTSIGQYKMTPLLHWKCITDVVEVADVDVEIVQQSLEIHVGRVLALNIISEGTAMPIRFFETVTLPAFSTSMELVMSGTFRGRRHVSETANGNGMIILLAS